MCELCHELAVKYLPDLTDEQRIAVLWNETAFPFCTPETLETQLIGLGRTAGRTIGKAGARPQP